MVAGSGGRREENAIYKAINASRESAITQNYFLKFGRYSSRGREGSTGTLLPIKPVPGWAKAHKARGTPRRPPPAGAANSYLQGLSALRLQPEKPHQRFHSSHFLLLNFKEHIYVPQVAHEPRHVKQFGVDGRGTFSRPGTFGKHIFFTSLSPFQSLRCLRYAATR